MDDRLKSALATIEMQWDTHRAKMEWLVLESVMVDILKSPDATPEAKVTYLKTAIDAFTKRGHFLGDTSVYP